MTNSVEIRGLLHDHIDGCAVLSTLILDLYKMAKIKFSFASAKEWLDFFQNPQEDILEKFGTITRVLQNTDALEALGYAYGQHRAKEGYVYVEAKFAPQYSTYKGLTLKQVADAMCKGLWRAQKDLSIRILPHICIGREAPPELGLDIAKICLDYDGEVVLGMACGEEGNPPEKHLPAYNLTYRTNVKRDCHTGEWVRAEPENTYRKRLLENVRTAVQVLKVDGMGHTIPLIDDAKLIKEVVDKNIRVTGCPASYIVSDVIRLDDIKKLGIPQLLDAGVRYTLNTDDDLFLPPMPKVLKACQNIGLTDAHWKQLADNVFKSTFTKDARKYL